MERLLMRANPIQLGSLLLWQLATNPH